MANIHTRNVLADKQEEYYQNLRAELAHAFLEGEEDRAYEKEKDGINTFTGRLGLGVKRIGTVLKRGIRSVYKGAVNELLEGGNTKFNEYVEARTADTKEFIDKLKDPDLQSFGGGSMLSLDQTVADWMPHLSNKEDMKKIAGAMARVEAIAMSLREAGMSDADVRTLLTAVGPEVDTAYGFWRNFTTPLPTPLNIRSLADIIHTSVVDDNGAKIEQILMRHIYAKQARILREDILDMGTHKAFKKNGVMYVTSGKLAYPVFLMGMQWKAYSPDGNTQISINDANDIDPARIQSIPLVQLDVPLDGTGKFNDGAASAVLETAKTVVIGTEIPDENDPNTFSYLQEEMLDMRLSVAGKSAKIHALDQATLSLTKKEKKPDKSITIRGRTLTIPGKEKSRSMVEKKNGNWVAKNTVGRDAFSRQAVDKYLTVGASMLGYSLKSFGTGIFGPAAIPIAGAGLGLAKAKLEAEMAKGDPRLVIKELPTYLAEAGDSEYSDVIKKALRGMKESPNLEKFCSVISKETPDDMLDTLGGISEMLGNFLKKNTKKQNTLAYFEMAHIKRVVDNRIMRKQQQKIRTNLRQKEVERDLDPGEVSKLALEINMQEKVDTFAAGKGNEVENAYKHQIGKAHWNAKKIFAHVGYAGGAYATGALVRDAIDLLGLKEVPTFGIHVPTGGGRLSDSLIAQAVHTETEHLKWAYGVVTNRGSEMLSSINPYRQLLLFLDKYPEFSLSTLLLAGGAAGAITWKASKKIGDKTGLDKVFGWGKKNIFDKSVGALKGSLKKNKDFIGKHGKTAAWAGAFALTWPLTWPIAATMVGAKVIGVQKIHDSLVKNIITRYGDKPDDMVAAVTALSWDMADQQRAMKKALTDYKALKIKDNTSRDTMLKNLRDSLKVLHYKHPILPREFFTEAESKIEAMSRLAPDSSEMERHIDTLLAIYNDPFKNHHKPTHI